MSAEHDEEVCCSKLSQMRPQGEKEDAKPKQNKMQRKGRRRHGWSKDMYVLPSLEAHRGRLPRQRIAGGGALPEQDTCIQVAPLSQQEQALQFILTQQNGAACPYFPGLPV